MLAFLALGFILLLAFAPSASAAPPVASFSVSPPAPLTLETVTFTSMSTGDITNQLWDLDGDGAFDDATGTTASRSFPKAGSYTVALIVIGPGGHGEQFQNIPVSNRAPSASIMFLPAAPVEAQPVNLVSTSTDADGTVVTQSWDLDGNGVFDDASGVVASRAFSPGNHTVRLRIVDSDGAAAMAEVVVPVASRAAQFLNPFPVVRLVGRSTATGVLIRRLTVESPPGSRVEVRCRGTGCPRRSQVRTARLLRFHRFERRLRARAVLEIFITNPNAIGKYTRFRIRKGNPPTRLDLCIPPDGGKPRRCPFS